MGVIDADQFADQFRAAVLRADVACERGGGRHNDRAAGQRTFCRLAAMTALAEQLRERVISRM